MTTPSPWSIGDDRNTDVNLATGNANLDAAVLGDPLLGDIEPGHDLQTRDDRGLKLIDLGRCRLDLEHTVYPITDPYAGRLGLEVDVAGTRFDRLGQDLIDEPYDRGLLGHLRFLGTVPLQVFEYLNAVAAQVALR